MRVHTVWEHIYYREDIVDIVVINVPTRASLAVKTKGLLFLWLPYLNNKSTVSSLLVLGFFSSDLLQDPGC